MDKGKARRHQASVDDSCLTNLTKDDLEKDPEPLVSPEAHCDDSVKDAALTCNDCQDKHEALKRGYSGPYEESKSGSPRILDAVSDVPAREAPEEKRHPVIE